MPDFYEVLKGHFEKVAEVQLVAEDWAVSLQNIRDTITTLMEQTFHAFPDVTEKADPIPLPPSSLPEDELPPNQVFLVKPQTEECLPIFEVVPVQSHTITYPDGANNGSVQVNYA